MKVSDQIKRVIKISSDAVRQRHLMQFMYESKSRGREERTIRPYMVCPNRSGKWELVGLPREEWEKPIDKRQPGHYLLEKLDIDELKVLFETFDDPGVPRKIVVNTLTSVVCRLVYDDEDEQEVMNSWTQIEGLDLT
jgi:hypothetical protein